MIKRLFSSQLRINMVSGAAMTSINIVVLGVAYPIYLHFLGYERYGVWLVLATVLSFAQLGDLGIRQAVMKLVAEEHGVGNMAGVREYAATGTTMLLFSGACVLVGVLILKHPIARAFGLEEHNMAIVVWLLPYMACLSIYVLLVQSCNAMLSGLGRMDLANLIQVLGRVVILLVTFLCLYLGQGVVSLLIGHATAYVFMHVLSLALVRRRIGSRWLCLRHLQWSRCRRILRFGGSVFGASAIRMFIHPFNKLMLTRYVGVTTVPVYEIALRATAQIKALFVTALTPLMPEVSQLAGQLTESARTRVISINRKARRLTVVCMGPLAVALLLGAPWLLAAWLGSRYEPAIVSAFRLALAFQLVALLETPAYLTLLGMGKSKHIIVGALIVAGGNLLAVAFMVFVVGQVWVNAIFISLLACKAVTIVFYTVQVRRLTRRGQWATTANALGPALQVARAN